MKNLLLQLSELDISLKEKDGQLEIYDPNDTLTKVLILQIEENKSVLLQHLKEIRMKRNFWTTQFATLPEALHLPIDFSRPLDKMNIHDSFHFELSQIETEGLKDIAKTSGTTVFMVILSIYNIMLNKLCNQKDVVVGTPSPDRLDADLKTLEDMYVNILPLRNHVNGGLRFDEFLSEITERSQDCFDNMLYQHEGFLEELEFEKNNSRRPLFDVLFSYESFDKLNGVISKISQETDTNNPNISSKFDLVLKVVENQNNHSLFFDYATNLFKRETIARFTTYFKKITTEILKDSTIKLSEINILSENEQHQLLYDFNNTKAICPSGKSIVSLFEAQVKNVPNKTAIIFGEQSVNYKELNAQVNRLSIFLESKGIEEGSMVAILLERSMDYIVSLLAVLKCGGIYLPMDLNYPDNRIDHILEDSEVNCLISTEKVVRRRSFKSVENTIYLDIDAETIDKNSSENKKTPLYESEFIYAIYTSGTTGRPKGILGSQKGLLNRLNWGWKHYNFGKDEVCCQKTSFSFVDHAAELFSPLLKGVPIVMMTDFDVIATDKLLEKMQEYSISRITLVPSLLKIVLQEKRKRELKLDALKYVFSSGEALTVQLANEFYKEFESARLINVYGSSEVSADATYYEVPRFNVKHILKYFKNLVHTENHFRYFNEDETNLVWEGEFTTPDIEINQIASNFMMSKITDYPLSTKEYYRKLDQDVIPYTVNTAAPAFIGHMTSALPDFVHDISKLISQMNQNLVKIETSKSLTLLEREAIAILHRMYYERTNEYYEENIQKLNANLGIITSEEQAPILQQC